MKFSPLSDDQSLAVSYAKAIGIILVVIGHYPELVFSLYSPYSFHMPLFFFLGGYLFSARRAGLAFWKDILFKYYVYIIYTYLVIGCVAVVLKMFYPVNVGVPFREGIIDTIYLAVKGNLHTNRLFMVAWFLFAYAFVLILFRAINACLHKFDYAPKTLLLFVLFMAAAWMGIGVLSPDFREFVSAKIPAPQYINFMSQVSVGLAFYTLGYLARSVGLRFDSLLVFLLFTCLVYVFRKFGVLTGLIMSWSDYRDGFGMSLFEAVSGIYAVFFVATVFAKALGSVSWFKRIGDDSKIIMSYHLVAFLLIDLFFHKFGFYNMIDAGADHFKFKGSLAVYVIGGLLIPIAFGCAYDFVCSRLIAFKQNSARTA